MRATEHFHTGYLAEVEIEGRLLEVGDAIDIKPYGWRIDFRADTTDENRRCQLRTIVRHEQIRDEAAELLDVERIPVLDGRTGQGRCRNGSYL